METQLARAIEYRDRQTQRLRCEQSGPASEQIKAFIATEFREHFAADVREFMPTLAGLYDDSDRLKAAVGYRAASAGPLFLEIYTNGPIEEVVRQQTGFFVPREEIVEVGSLACTGGRAAMEMVKALVPALIDEGFSWVVFTGADTVRNVFRRLHLKPVALCIANKSLLGKRRYEWGSYYDHNPVVMAGRLADGIGALDTVCGQR